MCRAIFIYLLNCSLVMNAQEKDAVARHQELIAPCGMNCGLCSGYLALKNDVKRKGIKMPYCAGCRRRNKKCAFLKKRCNLLLNHEVNYCYECKNYPCDRLLHLDERYRTHFHMSFLENLECIRKNGIQKFLKNEDEKWACQTCGEKICCHNGICFHCSVHTLKNKKKLYRWEDE